MDETATPAPTPAQHPSDMDYTVESSAAQESSRPEEAARTEEERYDQIAKAAAAGLMAHQHVETAVVEISGGPEDLVFHLHCTVIPDVDPSTVMELVAHGVIPNLERMIGQTFVSRDLNFSFAPIA